MDAQEIFKEYCMENGLPLEGESPLAMPQLLQLEDGTGVWVALDGAGRIRLEADAGDAAEWSDEALVTLLGLPCLVNAPPHDACPVRFAADGTLGTLLVIGERGDLADAEDFRRMLDAFVSIRAYCLSLKDRAANAAAAAPWDFASLV